MSAPEPKQAASERDTRDFLGGPVVRNPPANAGDTDLIPSSGRFRMPRGN